MATMTTESTTESTFDRLARQFAEQAKATKVERQLARERDEAARQEKAIGFRTEQASQAQLFNGVKNLKIGSPAYNLVMQALADFPCALEDCPEELMAEMTAERDGKAPTRTEVALTVALTKLNPEDCTSPGALGFGRKITREALRWAYTVVKTS